MSIPIPVKLSVVVPEGWLHNAPSASLQLFKIFLMPGIGFLPKWTKTGEASSGRSKDSLWRLSAEGVLDFSEIVDSFFDQLKSAFLALGANIEVLTVDGRSMVTRPRAKLIV